MDAKLDIENPWPGLEGFGERDETLFKGRSRETAELVRLVRTERLCVLYGKSGMGKSSLLRAGVFPTLRRVRFVPIYIRLKHDEREAALGDQVEEKITEAIRGGKIDAPEPIREQVLWEYFHRKDVEWWDAESNILTPVLVFDQFEELLTVGRENSERKARADAFLTELEDLVEHRTPDQVGQRFQDEPALARQYDFYKQDFRIVLCLREDFLPELEGLHERLNGILTNRFRLLPMNGEQALDVVLKPAPGLVDEATAIEIVERVSRARSQRPPEGAVDRASLQDRSVEPALLSVLCSELNRKRRQRGMAHISADLVNQAEVEAVLQDFYDREMKNVPAEVHTFVEEKLLTEAGARNRYARQDALQRDKVQEEHLIKLINAHILRSEVSSGVAWIELTHDRLAGVVQHSRDNRRTILETERTIAEAAQRERAALDKLVSSKQRHRRILLGAIGAIALVLTVSWILYDRARVNEELTLANREKEVGKREQETQRREDETRRREDETRRREVETTQLKKEAEQKREIAEARRLVDIFSEDLQPINADDEFKGQTALEDVKPPKAAVPERISELLTAVPSEEEATFRDRALLQTSQGLIYYRTGKAMEAENVLSKARDGLRKLYEEKPDDKELATRLVTVCFTLGDITRERLGPRTSDLRSIGIAAANYATAAKVIDHFLTKDGRDTPWIMFKADLLDREGDLDKTRGDTNAARSKYEAALSQRESLLVDSSRASVGSIRLAIARGWNKMGNAYFAENTAESVNQYQKSLTVLEAVTAEGKDSKALLDEAEQLRGIVWGNLGAIYVQRKRWEDAQTAFTKKVTCFQKLYSINPANLRWRQDLAAGLQSLAYYYMEEVPENLKNRGKALPLAMKAVTLTNEANEAYLKNLRNACGSILLRGDPAKALKELEKDVDEKLKELRRERHE